MRMHNTGWQEIIKKEKVSMANWQFFSRYFTTIQRAWSRYWKPKSHGFGLIIYTSYYLRIWAYYVRDAHACTNFTCRKGTAAFGSQRFHSTNRFSSEDGRKALTALAASAQLSANFNLRYSYTTHLPYRYTVAGGGGARRINIWDIFAVAFRPDFHQKVWTNIKKSIWFILFET